MGSEKDESELNWEEKKELNKKRLQNLNQYSLTLLLLFLEEQLKGQLKGKGEKNTNNWKKKEKK